MRAVRKTKTKIHKDPQRSTKRRGTNRGKRYGTGLGTICPPLQIERIWKLYVAGKTIHKVIYMISPPDGLKEIRKQVLEFLPDCSEQ